MARLIGYVHVQDPDGRMVVFGPEDHVPGWARAQMDDGCFLDGAPAVEVKPPAHADAPPPQSGRGSSAAAWAAWAQVNGVDVADGASRDDIIAACAAAGVPVDGQ